MVHIVAAVHLSPRLLFGMQVDKREHLNQIYAAKRPRPTPYARPGAGLTLELKLLPNGIVQCPAGEDAKACRETLLKPNGFKWFVRSQSTRAHADA